MGERMSLFFDAAWFDARLAERGLERGALADAAGIERSALHAIFTDERNATAEELKAFAAALGADVLEVTLRSGVAVRAGDPGDDPAARIESIEARLDAVDAWLSEFENAAKTKKKSA